MPRVGLVLGAGGIAGHAYHAGVLKALEETTGWDARDAEIVVGTSAGSHVGALLRAGVGPADLWARLTREPVSGTAAAILRRAGRPSPLPRPGLPAPRPAAPGLLWQALRRPGSVPPMSAVAAALPAGTAPLDTFAGQIRALFPDDWPADELWVVAVGFDTGRRTVFGRPGAPRADVGRAVAASCAIPAWFTPVEIGGVRYVDGGVRSPTNADLLRGRGLDLVIAVSPMSVRRGHSRLAPDLLTRHALRLRLHAESGRVRRTGTAVVDIHPTPADVASMGFNAMDPRRRDAVAAQAYRSTLYRLGRPDWRDRLAVLLPR